MRAARHSRPAWSLIPIRVLGALVAGLLIGLIEALASTYLGGEYKLVATFLVLVVILLLRPYGLFGTREIERL